MSRALTHGTARWLDDASNGNHRLVLTVDGVETEYEVEVTSTGFSLYYRDGMDFHAYHITTASRGLWTCDCPDADPAKGGNRYRCKHTRALKAALAKLPF